MFRAFPRRVPALMIFAAVFMLAAAISASAAAYSDVDPNTELGRAVSDLSDKGIISGMGDGSFGAAKSLTRAETCTVINKTFGFTEASADKFDDVPADHWGCSYIAIGRRAGYIAGVGNNRFEPDKALTVEQFCVIIRSVTGAKVTGSVSSGAKLVASSWAADAVSACLDAGFLKLDSAGHISSQTVSAGISDTSVPCSRGDMAMLLEKYVSDQDEAPVKPPLPMTARKVQPYDWKDSLFSYDPETTVMSYGDPAAAVTQGIDVSEYQGAVDWQKVKNSGVKFVIIRCGGRGFGTEGKLYQDKYFASNIKGASAAGLQVGVYFFATAVNYDEAYAEADYVLSLIGNYKSLITMPVVYDWEVNGSSYRNAKVKGDMITQCYYAFADKISQAGYSPMAYFNGHIGGKLTVTSLNTTDFWYARYISTTPDPDTGKLPAITTGWTSCHLDMWQYTSSGVCPGVSGNVDRIIAISK